jgi:hypothetical protein
MVPSVSALRHRTLPGENACAASRSALQPRMAGQLRWLAGHTSAVECPAAVQQVEI